MREVWMGRKMNYTFELTIWLTGEHVSWNVAHRFDSRPGIETIKALVEEAENFFDDLFDCEVEERSLNLNYIDSDEEEEGIDFAYRDEG